MNQSISTKFMTKDEWLKERQRGIGGSDVAAILGLSNWKTPLEVYNDKTAEVPIVIEENPKMKAGIMLEQVIADYYAEETGFKLQQDHKIRIHPNYPFMIGDMDRVIVSANGNGPGVFEAKSTSSMYQRTWEHEIPLMYFAQVQHYFFVTNYQWGEIGLLIDGWDFRHIPMEPAEDYMKLMLEKCESFWNDHVLKRIPPPPMNEVDLKLLFDRSTTGKQVMASDDIQRLALQSKTLKEEISPLTKDRNSINSELKVFMEDAEVLVAPGSETVLATFKTAKDKLKFDEKRFKTDHADLYAQYCDMVPGNRSLLIK